jgi:hypothetical protein
VCFTVEGLGLLRYSRLRISGWIAAFPRYSCIFHKANCLNLLPCAVQWRCFERGRGIPAPQPALFIDSWDRLPACLAAKTGKMPIPLLPLVNNPGSQRIYPTELTPDALPLVVCSRTDFADAHRRDLGGARAGIALRGWWGSVSGGGDLVRLPHERSRLPGLSEAARQVLRAP